MFHSRIHNTEMNRGEKERFFESQFLIWYILRSRMRKISHLIFDIVHNVFQIPHLQVDQECPNSRCSHLLRGMGDALPLGNRLKPHAGPHVGGNKANVEKGHDRRYMEFLEVSNSSKLSFCGIPQLNAW